jgi:hypothetical protein
MSDRNLILISTQKNDQLFSEAVAQELKLNLKVTPLMNQAISFIEKSEADLIFVDTNTDDDYLKFETAIQNQLGLFSDRINPNNIHYFSSQDLENNRMIAQSPLFGNYIFRNYENPKLAGIHYAKFAKTSLMDKSFGIKNFFNESTQIQTIQLKKSSQKQSAVEAIRNYLLKAQFQSRMASTIANAVDELIMNAIFTAPVDELGRRSLNTTPRDTVFELKDKSNVEAQIAFDGKYFAFTAVDHYGSLDREELLNHLSKVYTDNEYKIRTSVAGAGIGLSTVYRSGGSLFFSCEASTRTEVTVIFEKLDNYRNFRDQFRFINTRFYS